MRKLAGTLLIATPLTAGFVGIGLSPAGWKAALIVYGVFAGIALATLGITILTEPPTHPWEELNR